MRAFASPAMLFACEKRDQQKCTVLQKRFGIEMIKIPT
jgi:hypothetical protein